MDSPEWATFMWMVGFLEGEGSFCWSKSNAYALVQVGQKQREPLERLQRAYGGRIYLYRQRKNALSSTGSVYHLWNITGWKAARFMMAVYPFMSPRRKQQIASVIRSYATKRKASEMLKKRRIMTKRGEIFERPLDSLSNILYK